MRSAGAPTPSSHRSRRFALATVIPIAMLCVAQLLFAAVSRSATTATTFRPVADSSVYQAHPSANYGTKTTLRTDASPSIIRSYIRFNVTGISGTITAATLRLYADGSISGSVAAAAVTDTSWTETGLTWSNAPAIGTTASTVSSIASGTWISFDVTSLVKTTGPISIAVTSPSAAQESFGSSESGQVPQLVVVTDAATSTTTTTQLSTTTTQASVNSERPTAARCRVPRILARPGSLDSGSKHPAASSRPLWMIAAPSCNGER